MARPFGTVRRLPSGRFQALHQSTHTGGRQVSKTFDTERQVLEQVDRVQARVLDQQDMPPGSPIDADELALLQDWLDCESE